jgi:hypothetical protein
MKKTIALVFLSSAFGVLGCTTDSSEVASETNEALTSSMTVRVTCASQFFQRRECGVDTQGGRIVEGRITEEFSNPPFLCRDDDNHGIGSNHVWVDHGCAAEFEVRIELPAPVEGRERIRCASNGGDYTVCDSSLRNIRRIRLIRQESDRPCEEGRSFGHYDDAVWVDRGCRGVFEVTGRQGGGSSARVELFDRDGFSGNRYTVNGTINDLSGVGFNDRTESLIVNGGTWEACQHANFSGWCRTFGPGQYNDLGPLAGEISSIRPR